MPEWMPMQKRKRVGKGRAVRTAMKVGNWASLARASRARSIGNLPRRLVALTRQVNTINRMVETKSSTWNTGTVMRDLSHNEIYIVISPGNGMTGERLNMLQVGQGVQDRQGNGGGGNRIGDKVTCRGVMLRAIFENALNRPKVFYRVMVVKCAKSDVPTKATLFYNNSPVKMIDQVNTERYTVIAQKLFTISSSNPTASIANVTSGAPEELEVAGLINAGMGTKAINMWIPGRKFGRGGNITYEGDNSGSVKFFDYYIICLAYDWYGTPQDLNTVGKINSLYTKMYFKDA